MCFQPIVSYLSLDVDQDLSWLQKVIVSFNLSYDVTSLSIITPCIKIDKPLVVYIYSNIIGMNFISVDYLNEVTWTTHSQIK